MLALLAVLPVISFHIGAGPAEEGIALWHRQSNLQVFYLSALLVSVRTRALAGQYEPVEGLREMLKGTSLKVSLVSSDTVVIYEDRLYCHPEWGRYAPLPPCEPLPLTIRGSVP